MKEIAVFLVLVPILYIANVLFQPTLQQKRYPLLATYQSLILLQEELPHDHKSLQIYDRIYLLSDTASTSQAHKAIRLFSHPHHMTGIIHTYGSFQLSEEAMEEGFLELSNLNSYIQKTVIVPLQKQRCMGKDQKRKDGKYYCVLHINHQLMMDMARKEYDQYKGQKEQLQVQSSISEVDNMQVENQTAEIQQTIPQQKQKISGEETEEVQKQQNAAVSNEEINEQEKEKEEDGRQQPLEEQINKQIENIEQVKGNQQVSVQKGPQVVEQVKKVQEIQQEDVKDDEIEVKEQEQQLKDSNQKIQQKPKEYIDHSAEKDIQDALNSQVNHKQVQQQQQEETPQLEHHQLPEQTKSQASKDDLVSEQVQTVENSQHKEKQQQNATDENKQDQTQILQGQRVEQQKRQNDNERQDVEKTVIQQDVEQKQELQSLEQFQHNITQSSLLPPQQDILSPYQMPYCLVQTVQNKNQNDSLSQSKEVIISDNSQHQAVVTPDQSQIQQSINPKQSQEIEIKDDIQEQIQDQNSFQESAKNQPQAEEQFDDDPIIEQNQQKQAQDIEGSNEDVYLWPKSSAKTIEQILQSQTQNDPQDLQTPNQQDNYQEIVVSKELDLQTLLDQSPQTREKISSTQADTSENIENQIQETSTQKVENDQQSGQVSPQNQKEEEKQKEPNHQQNELEQIEAEYKDPIPQSPQQTEGSRSNQNIDEASPESVEQQQELQPFENSPQLAQQFARINQQIKASL